MTRRHLCISVRGNLCKTDRQLVQDWHDCIKTDDGKTLQTASDIRDFWMNQLAQGREVVPAGSACEGFDYKKGCPGHEMPDEGSL